MSQSNFTAGGFLTEKMVWGVYDAFMRCMSGVELQQYECCALHKPVGCGIKGGAGCTAAPHGFLPAIRALYVNGGDQSCHLPSTVKACDLRALRCAMDPRYSVCRFASPLGRHGTDRFLGGGEVQVAGYGAGYCYLGLMEITGRHRSARLLGPVPKVVDFLLIYRLLGARTVRNCGLEVNMINGEWIVHVAVDSSAGSRSGSFFMLSLMSLILCYGPNLRIGGEEDELFELVGEGSKVSGYHFGTSYWSLVGEAQLKLDRALELLMKDVVTKAEASRVAASFDFTKLHDVPGLPGKSYCDVCKFLVVAEGHEFRCGVKNAMLGSWSERRTRAWLSEGLIMLDVRLLLIEMGVPSEKLGEAFQKYTSGKFQSDFLSDPDVRFGEGVSSVSGVSARSEYMKSQYSVSLRFSYLARIRRDVNECFINI